MWHLFIGGVPDEKQMLERVEAMVRAGFCLESPRGFQSVRSRCRSVAFAAGAPGEAALCDVPCLFYLRVPQPARLSFADFAHPSWLPWCRAWQVLQRLLERCDASGQRQQGRTGGQYPARLVRFLIEHGADPRTVDQ
jgi:hypothetical protein